MNRKMLAYNTNNKFAMLALEEKLIKKFDRYLRKFNDQQKENKKEFDDIERELDKLRSMCDMNNKLENDIKERILQFDRMVKNLNDLKGELLQRQNKLESVNDLADRCHQIVNKFDARVKQEEFNYMVGLTNIAAQCGTKYDEYVKKLNEKIKNLSIDEILDDRLSNIERVLNIHGKTLDQINKDSRMEIKANGNGKRSELPL